MVWLLWLITPLLYINKINNDLRPIVWLALYGHKNKTKKEITRQKRL